MKKLANLFFATVIFIICSFSSVSAQLPWTENFLDNNGEGVFNGPYTTSAPTSCGTGGANYIAPNDFTISGDYSNFSSGDYFYVRSSEGRFYIGRK